MKRQWGSKQKPVPKLASTSSLGPSFPEIPSFAEGVILTEVIGTTVSVKSSVPSIVEQSRIVEGHGGKIWAAAMGDKQEHIKTGTISRKVIRHHPDSEGVRSHALRLLLHKLPINRKALGSLQK